MPTLQFIGASRADPDNVAASPARLVNLYREAAGESRLVMRAVPGLEAFGNLSAPVGRALYGTTDKLFAASGGFLHEVTSTGTASVVASIADDEDTIIASSRTNVMVAAGGDYTVYDGAAASVVTGGAITDVGSVTHLAGWTVLTELSGRRFEWTELATPGTRNALHVATAEGRDDDILQATTFGGNLYLLKETSTEIWGLTGLAGADAFARLPGGIYDLGILAKGLVANFGTGFFAIGSDGVAYVVDGSTTPVSTPAVETAIAQGTPTRCFYHEREGGKFCVLRFSDRPAWVYNLASQEWHERASGDEGDWTAIDGARAFSRWFILTADGTIGEMTGATTDFGATLYRSASSATLEQDAPFTVHSLEARSKRGFSDVSLMLELSRDGGITWGAPKVRSTGAVGEYDKRTRWNKLGQFETMTARLSITDDAEVPIYCDWKINGR